MVFPALGAGGAERLDALLLQPGVQVATTPRHASTLLVAGAIPEQAHDALRRIHDQLPHPRAALCWDAPATPLPEAEHLDTGAEDAAAQKIRNRLQNLQAELLNGRRASSAALLPDQPPAPWRGAGDHGQGGEGMMGGKPYGRPMAMPDEDLRDGLQLDVYPVSIGPFAPMFPPGLELQITLQGDVIQKVQIGQPPHAADSYEQPFREALDRPVSLAALERRRAAHHLRCIARLLRVRGSDVLAAQWLRAAAAIDAGGEADVSRLWRRLRWSGLLLGIRAGLGVLADQDAQALSGPALRAAGADTDARRGLPAYEGAGFRPVTQRRGDVRARIRQWAAEAGQSLVLAQRLADDTGPLDVVETPAGASRSGDPHEGLTDAGLNRLLAGLEWTEAVTVLASFDATSLRRMLRTPDP